MESTQLARLRRVAGTQTTRLTHYGRKTGKPHEVTIWFVLDGDTLYIGSARDNVMSAEVKQLSTSLVMSSQTLRANIRQLPY